MSDAMTDGDRKARLEEARRVMRVLEASGNQPANEAEAILRFVLAELERVEKERDEVTREAGCQRCGHQRYLHQDHEGRPRPCAAKDDGEQCEGFVGVSDLAAALARVKELEGALDAVWSYEESVQRDLKARGEVGDGTMQKLLRAKDLRAALAGGKP